MIREVERNKEVIVGKNLSVTYQELCRGINLFSAFIEGKNSQKVAIYSENCLEWIYSFYAGWKNHSVVIPIDHMASVEDVSYILSDSRPEIWFVSKKLMSQVEGILPGLPYQPEIIILDKVDLSQGADVNCNKPVFYKDKEDTAVIIYTSGTTGDPKGVMLSFKNLLANAHDITEVTNIYSEEETVMLLLPLHHIFPLMGTLIVPLLAGSRIAIAESLQAEEIIYTMNEFKVSIMVGVPRLYEQIAKGVKLKIDQSLPGKLMYNLVKAFHSKKISKKIFAQVHNKFGGHVKYLVSGGAALPEETAHILDNLGFEVLQGYGMTETAPMITFPHPGKADVLSVGTPLVCSEVRLVDNEIHVRGDNVMKGYYNRPEETKAVFDGEWLKTGDLGKFSKKGLLYITGRKKEIIVLPNGKNINPVPLEQQLNEFSEYIIESGIFLKNSLLQAAIYPNLATLKSNDIDDFAAHFKNVVIPEFNKKQSPHKRIMKFILVRDELPKTRLGKIQRFKLEEFIEQPTKDKKTSKSDLEQTQEYEVVKKFIESQVDVEVQPDDHLEFDLALDSLGKLGLLAYLENTFGVKIDEEKLFEFPTVRKIVEYVRTNKIKTKIEAMNWGEILKERIHLKLPKTWFTHNLFKNFSKNFFKIYFRFKGEGVENIPDTACIIAPNHQSFLDGMFVAAFLRKHQMKKTYFYAKEKHVRKRWVKFLANRNNIIVMNINKDLKLSIQKMAEVLKRDRNIIIFPEGTRTKDGKLGDFKKTFAILSKELNVPVVPVAIYGAYEALPRGKKIPRLFSEIRVQFLKPVYPEAQSYDDIKEEVVTNIEEAINIV